MVLKFRGHQGGKSILEFPNIRGVKMFMPPMVGYGYFLESPIVAYYRSTVFTPFIG